MEILKVLDNLTFPEVVTAKTVKFFFFLNKGKEYLVLYTTFP